MVSRKQAAQRPDVDLENLHFHVAVETQVLEYERFGLLGLFVEAHQYHGVEGVEGRHQKRVLVPVVMALGKGLQRIVAPGVFLVSPPSMEESLFDLLGHDGLIQVLIAIAGV